MLSAAPSLKIRNPWSWYAVAATRELRPGKIAQAVLNGENLVLWRSENGRLSAWSDRCPHRGMRLSLGAARGESLICPYHGWNFGTDGHCHHIPAHPNLSPSRAARTRIYPSAEASGYVWVCLGEPAVPAPRPLADMQPLRTIHLPVDIDVALAALAVRPLAPAAGGRLSEEDPTWSRDGGAIVAALDFGPAGKLAARVELPDEVSCQFAAPGGEAVRYRALLAPTAAGACAVHLAVDAATSVALRFALNRSLVALRHEIGALGSGPAVMRALEALVAVGHDNVHA
jgi:nitrite reductase/ring-hydroxylating ferredoxin subunit